MDDEKTENESSENIQMSHLSQVLSIVFVTLVMVLLFVKILFF